MQLKIGLFAIYKPTGHIGVVKSIDENKLELVVAFGSKIIDDVSNFELLR